MINELYIYARPKLSEEQKNQFNVLHVLCIAFFSSLTLLMDGVVFGIVTTVTYVALSLLTFLDKDFISRYLKLATLGLLNIFVAGTYFFVKLFEITWIVSYIVVLGVVFCVIYEIVVFIKIKNRLYSSPKKTSKSVFVFSGSTLILLVLVNRLFKIIPGYLSFRVLLIAMLLSAMVLIVVMSVQKTIIYIITRNKIDK